MPAEDYVMAGGGFPITVRGIGVVGSVTVSGLHERDDHEIGVAAICDYLGADRSLFALPALAVARGIPSA